MTCANLFGVAMGAMRLVQIVSTLEFAARSHWRNLFGVAWDDWICPAIGG